VALIDPTRTFANGFSRSPKRWRAVIQAEDLASIECPWRLF
jgi:hypothetical protein